MREATTAGSDTGASGSWRALAGGGGAEEQAAAKRRAAASAGKATNRESIAHIPSMRGFAVKPQMVIGVFDQCPPSKGVVSGWIAGGFLLVPRQMSLEQSSIRAGAVAGHPMLVRA